MSSALIVGVLKLLCLFSCTVRPTLANAFTAPVGGQVIFAYEPLHITWTPSSSGSVRIRLMYYDNEEMTTITNSTSNTGSYTWTIQSCPLDFAGYYLLICPEPYTPEVPCESTPNGRFSIMRGSVSSTTTTSSSSSRIPTVLVSSIATSTLPPLITPSLITSNSSSQGAETTNPSGAVSTSSSILDSTTTTEATGSATPPPSPSSSQSGSSGGLPEGATIALSIVLLVAAFVIAALSWMVIRKKRKAREAVIQVTPRPASPTKGYLKAELPNDNTRAELESHCPTDGIHELQ